MKRFVIDLAALPEEGKRFCGEIDGQIFDLTENDAKPAGVLTFDLRVQRFGNELLMMGQLQAPFEFTCVRTLHPFVQTIEIDSAAVSMEIEESSQIDVTDALREEVLIHFPTDPRCDDADDPQTCEIDPRYLAVDKPSDDGVKTPPHAEGDDRWSALDALKNTDPER